MNRLLHCAAAVTAAAVLWPGRILAQPGQTCCELGVQVTSATSSEFESTGVGVGARFSWHPQELFGLEAEFDIYPRDFPRASDAFSRGRAEALVGMTAGPTYGRLRPFARLRPGFVMFGEAPQAFACILIYPPPLSCALAGGGTVFALDIGGGAEVFATQKAFLRFDAGDLLLRYPGPVLDRRRMTHYDGFLSHDFRLAVGGGVRF